MTQSERDTYLFDLAQYLDNQLAGAANKSYRDSQEITGKYTAIGDGGYFDSVKWEFTFKKASDGYTVFARRVIMKWGQEEAFKDHVYSAPVLPDLISKLDSALWILDKIELWI